MRRDLNLSTQQIPISASIGRTTEVCVAPRWGNKGEGRLLAILQITIIYKLISLSYHARSHQCFLYISSPQNPVHPFKPCFLVLLSDLPHAIQVAFPLRYLLLLQEDPEKFSEWKSPSKPHSSSNVQALYEVI